MGGIVWGVSFALYEDAHLDPKYGRVVNESFAEYHVPVNADVGTVDVTVLNIPDLKFNPLGSRGIGEIGIRGVSAAVANAIYTLPESGSGSIRSHQIRSCWLRSTSDSSRVSCLICSMG